jgi:L-asparaginase
MHARTLRVLITGGTIDKVHNPHTETLSFAPGGGSVVPGLLAETRCHFPATQIVAMKDSLDFDDADRAAIADAACGAAEPALVITHGTGTIGQTARFLADQPGLADKTVVLTGALRPHSLAVSDAGFNLGGAVVAAQLLPPGVYGVMNGRVIPAARLTKNPETLRFDL